MPKGYGAEINLERVKTKKIFKFFKNLGIKDKEMLKTLNCGIGFCLIANLNNLKKIKKIFPKKYKPYVIGKVLKGKNKVILNGKINW